MKKKLMDKYPEIEKMIGNLYGVSGISWEGDSTLSAEKNGKKITIVIEEGNHLVDMFGFDIVKIMKRLRIDDVSSLILLRPKISDDVGFASEIVSLKEISFEEANRSESGETRIIFSLREIFLDHNQFYAEHISSTK